MNSDDGTAASEAIKDAGLLLERHAQNRYGDKSYEGLLPDELFRKEIDKKEFSSLIDALIEILNLKRSNLAVATWALGKTYQKRAVPYLMGIASTHYKLDDHLTYQALVGLDNFGKADAWEIIGRIAEEGLPKSRQFALELLQGRQN
jgi:hypothetical protein